MRGAAALAEQSAMRMGVGVGVRAGPLRVRPSASEMAFGLVGQRLSFGRHRDCDYTAPSQGQGDDTSLVVDKRAVSRRREDEPRSLSRYGAKGLSKGPSQWGVGEALSMSPWTCAPTPAPRRGLSTNQLTMAA